MRAADIRYLQRISGGIWKVGSVEMPLIFDWSRCGRGETESDRGSGMSRSRLRMGRDNRLRDQTGVGADAGKQNCK